ncbi:hypothetical protein M404DRAFT_167019, partial [Pisolithus tinctorius Marx 270]
KDMQLLGQIKFGIYQDHEDREGLEGLGLTDNEVMDMADVIACQQQVHINHEAMHIPSLQNPFTSDEDELIFFSGLCEVIAQDITPENFGLMPVEWVSDRYPTIETICIGQHAAKDVDILLADSIWYSWAHLWCQALSMLSYYLLSLKL